MRVFLHKYPCSVSFSFDLGVGQICVFFVITTVQTTQRPTQGQAKTDTNGRTKLAGLVVAGKQRRSCMGVARVKRGGAITVAR